MNFSNNISDSKTNPHNLISEHGHHIDDIKNKVLDVEELEHFEDSTENLKKNINFSKFSKPPQEENKYQLPSNSYSKFSKEFSTPAEHTPAVVDKLKNTIVFQEFEAETKPRNDQSRDEELLEIIDKNLNQDFENSLDFVNDNQEVGGAHQIGMEETKSKSKPLIESPANHKFQQEKELTSSDKNKDEEYTQDQVAKTLISHSGQIIETGQINLTKQKSKFEEVNKK